MSSSLSTHSTHVSCVCPTHWPSDGTRTLASLAGSEFTAPHIPHHDHQHADWPKVRQKYLPLFEDHQRRCDKSHSKLHPLISDVWSIDCLCRRNIHSAIYSELILFSNKTCFTVSFSAVSLMGVLYILLFNHLSKTTNMWPCDHVTTWLCDHVTVWLCDHVTTWPVTVWPCDRHIVSCSNLLRVQYKCCWDL